jgi:hypothetical protein
LKKIPVILTISMAILGAVAGAGKGQSQNDVLLKAGLSAEARAAILTVGDDVRKLDKSHEAYVKAAGELNGLYTKLVQKVREVSRLAAGADRAKADRLEKLLKAIEEMAEMSQSFNIQYLGLQQQMQDENRRFTLVSNIMKTKHDTAKNAINNVR